MAKYRIWSLEVWGNEEDGFEVNDRWEVGSVELADDATCADVVKALIAKGLITPKTTHEQVDMDDASDVDLLLDDATTGEPLFQLEREE
jgi:hypothetical protein